MTPARLNQLQCPACRQLCWFIDSDYRGTDGARLPYADRPYGCAHCDHHGAGWTLLQQSPPEFFLQPHDLYPMTRAAFDQWVGVLRTHFPHHPSLQRLGTSFHPRLPEEAAATRTAHARAYPVLEMRDQDGARRVEPTLRDASEWLDLMGAGDTLEFRRRDGGTLHVTSTATGFAATWRDGGGTLVDHACDLVRPAVVEAIRDYLAAGPDHSTSVPALTEAGGPSDLAVAAKLLLLVASTALLTIAWKLGFAYAMAAVR